MRPLKINENSIQFDTHTYSKILNQFPISIKSDLEKDLLYVNNYRI